jgi:hypothetical protein
MKFTVVRRDVPQPALLGADGLIKLLSAADYDRFDRDGLRLWCHLNARYGLPTIELITWLRDYIGDRSAIEIGSGSGDLAHHLGIQATDSKIQTDPIAAAFYRIAQQPVIQYPEWVEKLDALDAVKKYKPQVVVASWVTHWIDPTQPPPPGGGCMFGVKEDRLLVTGVTYVFIGNLLVHQHKPIMRLPHRTLEVPFLRSRANFPSEDRILIWNEA